ncbi:MAG: hypothetical protein AAGG08_14355 [Actinomycetota bacterium]
MFNLQGSEIIFILLLALVVLGPEKLPGAIRRFTRTYAELRKMGTSFQDEVRQAFDEPMREVRETADLIKQQVDVEAIEAEHEASDALDESAASRRADATPIYDVEAESAAEIIAAGTTADAADDFADDGTDVPGGDAAEALDGPASGSLAPPVAGTAQPGPGEARSGPTPIPAPPGPFAASNPIEPRVDDTTAGAASPDIDDADHGSSDREREGPAS